MNISKKCKNYFTSRSCESKLENNDYTSFIDNKTLEFVKTKSTL